MHRLVRSGAMFSVCTPHQSKQNGFHSLLSPLSAPPPPHHHRQHHPRRRPFLMVFVPAKKWQCPLLFEEVTGAAVIHACLFVCVQNASPCGSDGGSCEKAPVPCLHAYTPVCVHHALSVWHVLSRWLSFHLLTVSGLKIWRLVGFFVVFFQCQRCLKCVIKAFLSCNNLRLPPVATERTRGVAWQAPLPQTAGGRGGGLKPGAAIFYLVSAWFVCPWILRAAVALCRRRSNTSSLWKYRHTKSWVRAGLNHCATPPPPPIARPPSVPTEYHHILWTGINALALQRHTAVNIIYVLTKRWDFADVVAVVLSFWHLFIPVKSQNTITCFSPLSALSRLYRWSCASFWF